MNSNGIFLLLRITTIMTFGNNLLSILQKKLIGGARSGPATKMILKAALDTSLLTLATSFGRRREIIKKLNGLHTSTRKRTLRNTASGIKVRKLPRPHGSFRKRDSSLVKSKKKTTKAEMIKLAMT